MRNAANYHQCPGAGSLGCGAHDMGFACVVFQGSVAGLGKETAASAARLEYPASR